MAFLDNSGDIILDAVLTDAGRYRLAKGDGSFRIEKFALGDDEIDYSLYNNQDERGSAYYDVEILSTPILEAFTDNMSSMKSKLLSISRNNLLYLPVTKLDEITYPQHSAGGYLVTVDTRTESQWEGDKQGVIFGVDSSGLVTNIISVHQGIDNSEIPKTRTIDDDLLETGYLVEIDNRLGYLRSPIGSDKAAVSYIDDDNVASYYFTQNTDNNFVQLLQIPADESTPTVIAGAQGTKFGFKIASSLELETSTFLFQKLGSTVTYGTKNYLYIDTIVKITGATTGYKIDVPVRFIKFDS